MKISYTYFWNEAKDEKGRNLGFFGFEEGHTLSVAYKGELEVVEDEDELSICEKLFHIFNTEARHKDYRGPSMSVGSVIQVGEIAMACMSCGFVNIDISRSKIVSCDPRWRVV